MDGDDDELGGGSADFGGGWDDADFGGEGGGSMLSGGDGDAGSELLSAPRRVEKVEVNYSRAAKQVVGGTKGLGGCCSMLGKALVAAGLAGLMVGCGRMAAFEEALKDRAVLVPSDSNEPYVCTQEADALLAWAESNGWPGACLCS